MIIPRDYNYMSLGTIACLALLVAGVGLGYWMCNLEKKYKMEDVNRAIKHEELL